MNVGYLLYHSVERPRDLFLVDGEREVRYDEAVRDLWKFVGAVGECYVGSTPRGRIPANRGDTDQAVTYLHKAAEAGFIDVAARRRGRR